MANIKTKQEVKDSLGDRNVMRAFENVIEPGYRAMGHTSCHCFDRSVGERIIDQFFIPDNAKLAPRNQLKKIGKAWVDYVTETRPDLKQWLRAKPEKQVEVTKDDLMDLFDFVELEEVAEDQMTEEKPKNKGYENVAAYYKEKRYNGKTYWSGRLVTATIPEIQNRINGGYVRRYTVDFADQWEAFEAILKEVYSPTKSLRKIAADINKVVAQRLVDKLEYLDSRELNDDPWIDCGTAPEFFR